MPITISASFHNGFRPIHSKASVPLHKDINEQFFSSIYYGSHSDVINALKNGADINYRDDRGKTALHESVLRHFDESRVKIMHSLINRGVKLDAEDSDGETALHWAIIKSFVRDLNLKLEIINLLLKAGASPNAQNKEGDTPLNCAIDKYWPNNQIEIIESLLQAGACPTIKNKEGRIPLHNAVDKGLLDVVKVLLKKTAGKPTEDGLAILKEDSDVNVLDGQGLSPLQIAAYRGDMEIVRIIIDAGADLELRNTKGGTALRFAVEQDHKDIVEILCKAGADINTRLNGGFTPFDWADANGKSEMVAFLIKLGAASNLRYRLTTLLKSYPTTFMIAGIFLGTTFATLTPLIMKLFIKRVVLEWQSLLLYYQDYKQWNARVVDHTLTPYFDQYSDYQQKMTHI